MRGNDAAHKPTAGSDAPQQTPHPLTSETAATPVPAGVASFSVAGVLVLAHARAVPDVAGRIASIPGAVVHASAAGKLAVTLEAHDPAAILEQLMDIQRMPGVMSAVLVSEHSEPLDTIDEELTDE